MKKILLLFIYSLCFSEDINKLYSEAQDLENKGNYKEAMLLYKKAADLSIPKNNQEDKYLIDLAKNDEHKVDSFTNMKKAFYQNQINKVDDKETDDNLKQLIVKDFDLFPYKKNYLLPATYNLNKLHYQMGIAQIFQVHNWFL